MGWVSSILDASFSFFGLAIAMLLIPLTGLAVLVTRRALGPPVAEAVMLVLGAGIGLVAVAGLILAQTPVGLSQLVWLLFGGGCLAVIAVAARRVSIRVASVPWPAIVVVALTVAVGGSGLAIARSDAGEQAFSPFTAVGAVHDGAVVRISIHSWEESEQIYVVEVTDGEDVDRRWAAIRLAPGDSWVEDVPWPGDAELLVTVQPVGGGSTPKLLTLSPSR